MSEPTTRTCGECQKAPAIAPTPNPDSVRAYAAEHGLCLSCGRWRELVGHRHMNASVRARGQHYWIGEEPTEEQLRRSPKAFGFGGQPFRIEFTDEDLRIRERQIVYTRNLNHQGEIPAHFRDRLPDNAILTQIKSDEYQRKGAPVSDTKQTYRVTRAERFVVHGWVSIEVQASSTEEAREIAWERTEDALSERLPGGPVPSAEIDLGDGVTAGFDSLEETKNYDVIVTQD